MLVTSTFCEKNEKKKRSWIYKHEFSKQAWKEEQQKEGVGFITKPSR